MRLRRAKLTSTRNAGLISSRSPQWEHSGVSSVATSGINIRFKFSQGMCADLIKLNVAQSAKNNALIPCRIHIEMFTFYTHVHQQTCVGVCRHKPPSQQYVNVQLRYALHDSYAKHMEQKQTAFLCVLTPALHTFGCEESSKHLLRT